MALFLCFAGAAWLARFAYLRITLKPTPRPDYWSDQLAALDPAPTGSLTSRQIDNVLNGFDFIQSHAAITSLSKFDVGDLLAGSWERTRPDISAAIAVMETPEFVAAREQFRSGVRAGWQEHVDLTPPTMLASLAQYRHCAKWLTAHSRHTCELQQQDRVAVDDWLFVLGLARQCRRQGIMICQLVATASESLVAHEIMLSCKENLGHVDIRSIADKMEEIRGPRQSIRALLNGERIYMRSLLDYCYVRQGGNWLDVSELVNTQLYAGFFGGSKATTPPRIWNLTSPIFHDYETACRNIDAVFAHYESYSTLSSMAKLQNTMAYNSDRFEVSVLDGIYGTGPMVRYLFLVCRGELLMEVAMATLALNEFHLRRGVYPDKLTQLVPELLARVPIDRSDDQPLRYRKEGNGYILYSVGSNGIDDGGTHLNGLNCMDENNPDLVFNLIDRGQAPER